MQQSCHRTERGAVAVEFALVAPILLGLVFGIIDFGFAINRYSMLANAAREGVRAASLGHSSAEIEAQVRDGLSDLGGDVDIDVDCLTADGSLCGNWSNQESGGTAIVTVAFTHEWLTPIGGLISEELEISKTSMMRIE